MALLQFHDDSELLPQERDELQRILHSNSKPIVQFVSPRDGHVGIFETQLKTVHAESSSADKDSSPVANMNGNSPPTGSFVRQINTSGVDPDHSMLKSDRVEFLRNSPPKSPAQIDAAHSAAIAAQNGIHQPQYQVPLNPGFFGVTPEFYRYWTNLVQSSNHGAAGMMGISPFGFHPAGVMPPNSSLTNAQLSSFFMGHPDRPYFHLGSPALPQFYGDQSHQNSFGRTHIAPPPSEFEHMDEAKPEGLSISDPSTDSPGESNFHPTEESDSCREDSPEIVIGKMKKLVLPQADDNTKTSLSVCGAISFGDIPDIASCRDQQLPLEPIVASETPGEQPLAQLPQPNPPSDTQSDDIFEDAVDEITELKPSLSEATTDGSYKDASQEFVDKETVTDTTAVKGAVESVAVDTKPKSWASLFSNTAAATNAKVVSSGVGQSGLSQLAIINGSDSEDLALQKALEASKSDSVGLSNSDFNSGNDGLPVVSTHMDKAVVYIARVIKNLRINHKGAPFQLRGLLNCGNSCYVSAVLQALIACPPFFNFLRSLAGVISHRTTNTSTPVLDSLVRFVVEFDLDRSRTGRSKTSREVDIGKPFDPTYIHRMVSRLKPDSAFMFKGRQEDAEEFLGAILNALQEELVTCISHAENKSTSTTGRSADKVEAAESDKNSYGNADEWQEVGSGRKTVITRETRFDSSPISEIFMGKLRYSMQLQLQGAKESVSLQPFFTLPLEIQVESIDSVVSALRALVSKEVIKGVSGGRNLKETVDGHRGTAFEDLPVVLILQLKYFFYEESGPKKLVKDVHFDVDLFIKPEFLSPGANRRYQSPQKHYKLFAVVYHWGDKAEGGHYTAAVFHGGGWMSIDDSRIAPIAEANLTKFEPPRVPYLLFYRRVDSLMSQQN